MLQCSGFYGRQLDLCEGHGRDGRPDPDLEYAAAWRRLRIRRLSPQASVGTTTTFKLPALWHNSGTSLGAGDSFEKILRWTRLKEPAIRLIKWWFQVNDCGCRARQAKWNERLPWPKWWRDSVGTWLKRWI